MINEKILLPDQIETMNHENIIIYGPTNGTPDQNIVVVETHGRASLQPPPPQPPQSPEPQPPQSPEPQQNNTDNEPTMVLSPIGEIVKMEWEKSFVIRKELFCDEFVIMPNHIHAILRIKKSYEQNKIKNDFKIYSVAMRSPESISSFVAGFKSSATKLINEHRKTPKSPVWQPRFHDHIIRDENEYKRIARYIQNNIRKWAEDRFYSC